MPLRYYLPFRCFQVLDEIDFTSPNLMFIYIYIYVYIYICIYMYIYICILQILMNVSINEIVP